MPHAFPMSTNMLESWRVITAILLAFQVPLGAYTSAQAPATNDVLGSAAPSVQLVPDRGKPVLRPLEPGSAEAGMQLGHYHPSLTTAAVGWAFAWELSDRKPVSEPAELAKLQGLTALWDGVLISDRALRAGVDRTLAGLHHDAIAAIVQANDPDRSLIVSRCLIAQAATNLAQIRRTRQGVEALAAAAKELGFDEYRLSSAKRLAQAVASLQLGLGLVNGGGLPAADIDMFTATVELLETLRLEGNLPSEEELTPLWDTLVQYALSTGHIQAERLDAAAEVGARGVEDGSIQAPATERKRASALSWRMHVEQVNWLPKLLDAMPTTLRERAEPEFMTAIAPDHFPDKGGMGAVIRMRAAAPMDSPEQASEIARLVAWYGEAYPSVAMAVLLTYGHERASLFAPVGSQVPPRDRAQSALADALKRREATNHFAAQWLGSIDPTMDVDGVRASVDFEARQLEGEINRRRMSRRYAPEE